MAPLARLMIGDPCLWVLINPKILFIRISLYFKVVFLK